MFNKIKNMKNDLETQLKTRIDDLESDLDKLEGVVYDENSGVDAIYAELGTLGTTVGVISNNVNNDTSGLGAIYSDLGSLITTVGDISNDVYDGTSGLDAIYTELTGLDTIVGNNTSDVTTLETTVFGDGTYGLVQDVVDISNIISNYNSMFNDISTNISDISAILVTDVSYVPTDVQAWLENNYVTYHDDLSLIHI